MAAIVSAVACDDDEPGAAPTLRGFFVVGADGSETDLLVPPDGGVGELSPLSTFRALFDQLLDGSKVEDPATVGPPLPRPDVVVLTWTNPPGSAVPNQIGALTAYDPGGILDMGPGPSLLVRPVEGLPSDAILEVDLNRTRITGKQGQPFVGPHRLSLNTLPFTASIDAGGDEPVSPVFELKIAFSNRPSPAIAAEISVVHVASGMPVPLVLAPDPERPTTGFIARPEAGVWSLGSHLVTVGLDALDAFAVPIASAARATFVVVMPGDGAAPGDGGIPGDGGVPGDGGSLPDGPAPVPDAAAGVDALAGADAILDAASAF
jgi:hypothetical protein